ncbi:MAG: DUF11 domain-containing protein [Lachnospiraceae bacterium]|nr:DUF11 domain-containing protein [Lachnospiraceae bacterium]
MRKRRKRKDGVRILISVFLMLVFCAAACNETPAESAVTENKDMIETEKTQVPETEAPTLTLEEQIDSFYDYSHTVRTAEDAAVRTDPVPADRETQFQALLQTVFAYYHKNPYCQYDESHVTKESTYRNYCRNVPNWSESPEYASKDQYYYAVCNIYPMAVYYQAFGIKDTQESGIPYFTRQMKDLTRPVLVKKWENNTEETIEQILNEVRELLEPGDIIAGYGKTGHALLYLGDIYGDGIRYVTHCWGANFDENGRDRYEAEGAIYIQPEDEALYGKTEGKPSWDLHQMSHSSSHIVILRYFNARYFPNTITASAASRLVYPDLYIDRYLSCSPYNSVSPGEELTLTTEVRNLGTQVYEDLEIEEVIPEGTERIEGELRKSLRLEPGATYRLTLKLRVTARPGEQLRFPKGRAADIPTREIRLSVGTSHLTESEVKRLQDLADAIVKGGFDPGTELKAVNELYERVIGTAPGLPDTVQEFLDLFLTSRYSDGTTFLTAKKSVGEDCRLLSAMQPLKMFGGLYRLSDGKMQERMLDVRDLYFEPGDVLIRLTGSNTIEAKTEEDTEVLVILGDGRALVLSKEISVKVFSWTEKTGWFSGWPMVDYILSSNQFIVLRPSLILPARDE